MAKKSKSLADSARPPLASRSKLNRFLAGVAKLRERVKHLEPVQQHQALRTYLQENTSRRQREQLFGRAFADALKSPSQKLGTAKAPSGGRARGSKKRRRTRKKSRR